MPSTNPLTIPSPENLDFTVYIKSRCPYCTKVKALLNSTNIKTKYINTDPYISDSISKEQFFNYIQQITGKRHRTFPIVFFDAELVGGYTETQWFINH